MRFGNLWRRFVRRSDDGRLERLLGTDAALRPLFHAMAARFDASKAEGFAGELQFDLRTSGGDVRRWTLVVNGDHARGQPGPAEAPAVTIKAGLADFLRMAAGELDPGKALLSGRLDFQGDFEVVTRLGPMFGAPSAF